MVKVQKRLWFQMEILYGSKVLEEEDSYVTRSIDDGRNSITLLAQQ